MPKRADVVFADGRRISQRHVILVRSDIALTSFGSFRWREGAWRWVCNDKTILELPRPVDAPAGA